MNNTPYAAPQASVTDIDSDETNIRVEYELKFLDYYLYVCTHQMTSWVVQLIQVALALQILLLNWEPGKHGFAVFGAIVAYLALWLIQFVINLPQMISKRNRSLLTQHTVVILPDGVSDATAHYSHFWYWSGVSKVVSRPGFVAIYTTAVGAILIPSRAFANSSHRQSFIATLRKNVGKLKGQPA